MMVSTIELEGVMKKIEFTAWIGKTWKVPTWYTGSNLRTIWLMRGIKSDWDEDDWPPVKVKITIEEAKK